MAAPMWIQAFAVAGGGAIGSLARWGCWQGVHLLGWDRWPLATLGVNVVGCGLIGACARVMQSEPEGGQGSLMRAFVIFGVLGGLTTFSALGVEVFEPLRAGKPGQAMAILMANVVFGIGAVAIGWSAARVFVA